MIKLFIEVLVEIKAWKVDKTFTYKVPEKLKNEIEIGKRVIVPFQNRELEGFVMDFAINVDYEVKDIIAIIDEKPVLNEELLLLGKYLY